MADSKMQNNSKMGNAKFTKMAKMIQIVPAKGINRRLQKDVDAVYCLNCGALIVYGNWWMYHRSEQVRKLGNNE